MPAANRLYRVDGRGAPGVTYELAAFGMSMAAYGMTESERDARLQRLGEKDRVEDVGDDPDAGAGDGPPSVYAPPPLGLADDPIEECFSDADFDDDEDDELFATMKLD